jgi:hypothetical protein
MEFRNAYISGILPAGAARDQTHAVVLVHDPVCAASRISRATFDAHLPRHETTFRRLQVNFDSACLFKLFLAR